ncbi:hypothetical protein EGM_17439 [Macaca fascicularis]|uniref:AN1-type domain-containing protein n=1 Tax=Macaca fascicularis TaxID=9541 RepID=G7PC43_MACFA|nr:hypothetical protein EGM_17439 [Macaca fascicularis]
MAELDIGQHCQVEHCRRRDFLPFVCDDCSGIFCLEHRSRESHGCPEQTERIYFQVFLPKGSKEKSKPMFFCHRWSIGKAIDFAASLASLKNDNNKLTAKKLRLCHIASGEALPLDHTLETWIAKEDCPLYNGGNIILEYLNDEEQFCKNVESYLE